MRDLLAGFLRDEHRFYRAVQASFMPALGGFEDSGEWPLLVLEDLSAAEWPPPWTHEGVAAVGATTSCMRSNPCVAAAPK